MALIWNFPYTAPNDKNNMLRQLDQLHQRIGLGKRCALALAIFVLAILMRFLVFPVEAGYAYITFYPMMVLCFYLCGIRAGFIMVILSTAAAYYIFEPPHWKLEINREGSIALLSYAISSVFIAYIIRRMQMYAKNANLLLVDSQKSNVFHKKILEDQTELVCRFLPDGTLTYVNPSFCHYFGVSRHELIGSPWKPIVFPEDLPLVENELSKLSINNPIVDIENRVIGSDGDLHWCRFINRAFFDADGNLVDTQSVGRDISIRKNSEDQIRELAYHDGLTKLPNRRLLLDRLNQALTSKKRNGTFGALMFIDLDKFKSINDAHGHEAGDLLLMEVANRLNACIREMDTVARVGGDEFVVMIGNLDQDLTISTPYISAIAQKISLALAKPYDINVVRSDGPAITLSYTCTASIGVTIFPHEDGISEDFLRQADEAMYQAKALGRNTIHFYSENLDT